MDWAWQLEHTSKELFPEKKPYAYKSDLDKEVKEVLAQAVKRRGDRMPKVIVIGALGRCGTGALELCREVGVPEANLIKFDMAETAKGGPFEEIRESDVFVNCIYLDKNIPKFVTEDFLKQGERNLSVVCDVSCDTTNPNNPIPFCDTPTYFNKPTIALPSFDDPPLSYITIDHLPSLLPREASSAFSEALLPSLLQLSDRSSARVWIEANDLFKAKVASMDTS